MSPREELRYFVSFIQMMTNEVKALWHLLQGLTFFAFHASYIIDESQLKHILMEVKYECYKSV